jgi:hypothetical protein
MRLWKLVEVTLDCCSCSCEIFYFLFLTQMKENLHCKKRENTTNPRQFGQERGPGTRHKKEKKKKKERAPGAHKEANKVSGCRTHQSAQPASTWGGSGP